MSKSIYLTLTDDQHEKLQPLFDQANIAYAEGPNNRGVIFAQIRETDEVHVRFVPAEAVGKIAAILEKIWRQ